MIELQAVIIGGVLGVVAGIPTIVLLFWLMVWRKWQAAQLAPHCPPETWRPWHIVAELPSPGGE